MLREATGTANNTADSEGEHSITVVIKQWKSSCLEQVLLKIGLLILENT